MCDFEKEKQHDLVTVAVITYHSSDTVLETLDSIVTQSYGSQNIELIISDDGSRDNTVQVIEQWLAQNQNYFYDVKFFANKINGGIPKNCNVAWRAATSEWIKTIAGDDILFPNCIEDNVKFVQENTDEKIAVVFSKMQHFKVGEKGDKILSGISPDKELEEFFSWQPERQFNYLQHQGFGGAPSAFIKRSHLEKIGFADERFLLMEDFPLWFKLTKSGCHLTFMDKMTVYYRVGDSVSNSKSRLINEKYIHQIIDVERKLVIPTLKKYQIILKYRKILWPLCVIKVAHLFSNKRNVFSLSFMGVVLILKPFFIKSQLKKVFQK